MRTVQRFLFILLMLICWQNANAQGDGLPTINIDRVEPMDIPNQPQMFSVYGSATLPEQRRNDVNSVIIYTKSVLGGNIHLQQTEVGTEIEKRKVPKYLILDNFAYDTASRIYRWEISGIWLGKPDKNDGIYEVYVIMVRTRSSEDVNQLLNTNDIFANRNDLLKELVRRNLEPVVTFTKVKRKE